MRGSHALLRRILWRRRVQAVRARRSAERRRAAESNDAIRRIVDKVAELPTLKAGS
jgi:hypothetical protein